MQFPERDERVGIDTAFETASGFFQKLGRFRPRWRPFERQPVHAGLSVEHEIMRAPCLRYLQLNRTSIIQRDSHGASASNPARQPESNRTRCRAHEVEARDR